MCQTQHRPAPQGSPRRGNSVPARVVPTQREQVHLNARAELTALHALPQPRPRFFETFHYHVAAQKGTLASKTLPAQEIEVYVAARYKGDAREISD